MEVAPIYSTRNRRGGLALQKLGRTMASGQLAWGDGYHQRLKYTAIPSGSFAGSRTSSPPRRYRATYRHDVTQNTRILVIVNATSERIFSKVSSKHSHRFISTNRYEFLIPL